MRQANGSPEVGETLQADSSARAAPRPSESPARKSTTGFESKLLSFLGVASLAGGLALLAAPHVSWQAAQIAQSLGGLGLQAGALATGGIALIGLGLVRRAVASAPANEGTDDSLLLEQIATDLVQLRGAAGEMGDTLARLSGELERLSAAVAEARAPAAGAGQQDDAIFRLAASLDQLGARVEQRLDVQHAALRNGLEEMDAALARAERAFGARAGAEVLGEGNGTAAAESIPSLGLLDEIEDAPQAPLPQMVDDDGATIDKLERLSHLLADPNLRAALDALRA